MNIAQQAYQDGQECRKANGMQVADEVIANRAMEAFTHRGLDFQHWQLYHGNWIAWYQSVEDVPQEQARVITTEDATYTLVPSRTSDRYALDDPLSGRTETSGDALAHLLNGQWIVVALYTLRTTIPLSNPRSVSIAATISSIMEATCTLYALA